MFSIIKKKCFKPKFVLIIAVTILGFIAYSFRLEKSLLFAHDTARDTLHALNLFRERKLTLIGPPASFGQYGIREIYFGSLSFYIGILGLIVSRFDPVGAIYPNTVLFTLSIPIFYLLMANLLKRNKEQNFLSLILYTVSPITVYHARFFWNPNLIIPFSVLFWWLVLNKPFKKHHQLSFFLAGMAAAVMFNLHYFSIFPILIYITYLLYNKKFSRSAFLGTGYTLLSLPLLIFELRHKFYLTKAFLFNMTHINSNGQVLNRLIYSTTRFFDAFYAILGLKYAEVHFPILLKKELFSTVALLIGFLLIRGFLKKANSKYRIFFLIILITNIFTLKLSPQDEIHIRYLFSIYPLLIWFIAISLPKNPLKYLIFIPIVYASFLIVTTTPTIKDPYFSYVSIDKLKKITNTITKDVQKYQYPNYNISENMSGDARANSFRYFLVKDAKRQPNSKLAYTNLSALYIISPSLKKIYRENRWEFYATPNLKLTKTVNFGEVKLFKFASSLP